MEPIRAAPPTPRVGDEALGIVRRECLTPGGRGGAPGGGWGRRSRRDRSARDGGAEQSPRPRRETHEGGNPQVHGYRGDPRTRCPSRRWARPAEAGEARGGVRMAKPLLAISDLHVSFRTSGEPVEAVRGVSLEVGRGESVALVGESGSGKSVTALSVLRLLPYPQAWHPAGHIEFDDESLLDAAPAAMRSLRGRRISMIFQEPMTSLNPLHTVEKQIREALRLHRSIDAAAARDRVLEVPRAARPRPPARCRASPRLLPPPALRRAAPAGHDRDGPRERFLIS